MRVSTTAPVPAYEPITITLDTIEEARALKLLCTTTAEDAVLSKRRRPGKSLNVTRSAVRNTSQQIFRALKAQGVKYLNG